MNPLRVLYPDMFQPIIRIINPNERNIVRILLLPVLVAFAALAVAVIGATIVSRDSGIYDVNLFVERLSGDSGSW